ncbi:MAG: aspartate kinase [Candidatus Sumerlaeaceae bacterium]|nr:aspartate kinase [Candidatus Sumerlaeaceae bacterium]
MALIVQKFGGSSVADPDRIRHVAKLVTREYDRGNQVVVVVSAMGKTTDKLLELAHQVSENPDPREIDMLISTGEQISIAMLAIAIQSMGYPAKSFTGPQVGIITDNAHRKAKIVHINDEKIRAELDKGRIVIVAGFQGITMDNEITTLGRGGSDTTAVALAAALKADVCDIYTDVEGVYTADPRIVPNARKLDRISYDEMLELASLGAKVLHSRSVEFAKNYNVPIHVRSSFVDVPGTMVVKEVKEMEDIVVSGVAYNRNEAKISILGVPDRPGIAAEVFGALGGKNIVVDMIIQNVGTHGLNDISFTVSKEDLPQALEVAREVAQRIGAKDVAADSKIAKVSVVGVGMKSHANVAGTMFRALAKNNINIEMISTSEIKISCVIREEDVDKAVQAIHEEFELAEAKNA